MFRNVSYLWRRHKRDLPLPRVYVHIYCVTRLTGSPNCDKNSAIRFTNPTLSENNMQQHPWSQRRKETWFTPGIHLLCTEYLINNKTMSYYYMAFNVLTLQFSSQSAFLSLSFIYYYHDLLCLPKHLLKLFFFFLFIFLMLYRYAQTQ